MVLYLLPSDGGTRAAFVCGRRIGSAVARNRARRLLREAWRSLAPGLQGGFDIVFVARTDIKGARVQEVVADMSAALRHLAVVR